MIAALAHALAAAALAQPAGEPEHVANWTWTIATDDGDRLVEPGETATVTVTIDLSVDPPGAGITGEPICNWAVTVFDVLVASGTGQVLGWDVLGLYDEFTGDLTTTDGVSLYNINAANYSQLFVPCEPCSIFEFYWRPDTYEGQVVEYVTETEQMLVIEGGDCTTYPDGEFVDWPVGEALISLHVACAADANQDGDLDVLDFVAFQQAWQAADPAADCDEDEAFTVLDFVCCQQLFQEGCP